MSSGRVLMGLPLLLWFWFPQSLLAADVIKPVPSPSPAVKRVRHRRRLPALLIEVEKKYTKAVTLIADFTQTNEIAALNQKKISSGRIVVKQPGKVRWETAKPDSSVMVSDGKKFWFYTPPFDESEHGQLIERKSSEMQTRLLNALLSGSFSLAREMKIKRLGNSKFTLTPKPGSAGTVSRAEITVDPKAKLITQVLLQHVGGNKSEITLSNIKLGESLPDAVFVFVPPPNTDRVDAN